MKGVDVVRRWKWVVVGVFTAMLLGGGVREIRRSAVQLDAVQALRSAGGHVSYSRQEYSPLQDGGRDPLIRRWLVSTFGEERCGLVRVVLLGPKATPSDVGRLSDLPYLREVVISDTKITRQYVLPIVGTSIRHLSLYRCIWDANAVEALGRLKSLESIGVATGDLAGKAELSFLADLDRLQAVAIEYSRVDIARLCDALDRKNIKYLSLRGSKLEGDLRPLGSLSQVTWLSLRDTDADDSCVKCVAQMHAIETLDLSGSRVTKEGLKCLHCMPVLRSIALWDLPSIDDSDLVALRGALPDAAVDVGSTSAVLDAISK